MKIDNVANVYDIYRSNAKTIEPKKKADEPKKDEISISSNAKDYQVAFGAVRNSPDIRENVVEDVRRRMNSGDIDVSASDIADKLISAYF